MACSRTDLKLFQEHGVAFIDNADGRMILGDDMGLGKTIQALVWCERTNRRAVIVVPASVKYNWAAEIEAWTNSKYIIVTSKVEQLVEIPDDVRYIILSYAYMKTRLVAKLPVYGRPNAGGVRKVLRHIYEPFPEFRTLQFYGFNTLVLDESHYAKNYKSWRTRATMALAKQSRYVLQLSGTAIKNRPVELWTQLNMVDSRRWGNFIHYGIRYCAGRKTRFGWDFKGATNLEELHQRIAPYYLRRRKQDVLDQLPDKTRQTIYHDMDDANLRDTYLPLIQKIRDLDERRHLLGELAKLKCALARLMAANTADFIEDVLESTEGKTLVFTAYVEPMEFIAGRFANQSVAYHGGLNAEQKKAAEDEFKMNPRRRLFVATIRSSGLGLNLQVADRVIFNDIEWSPSDMIQAEDRAWRMGQKNNVNVYLMGFKDTYHEVLFGKIIKKAKIVAKVMDGETIADDDVLDTVIRTIKSGGASI